MALRSLGVGPGAISPLSISFHVRGDLYLVPELARPNHECGGSINFVGTATYTGGKIEFSHIFYRDLTGHHDKPFHWNHELWIRKNEEEFKLFSKKETVGHTISQSDWIEIYCVDNDGDTELKRVNWKD